ncbi:MAG: HupE/UreJ family protein, partial [Verrucomicrobiaceae bacterium]|nr:HupE/UreJ family protein [Verrucomicrobiaceae bacterium]
NIYDGDVLRRQEIFDKDTTQIDYALSSHQRIGNVIAQFIREGVHHIFIGPDHILFIVGLLLLGGTIGRLLRIVTAFTIAHSITLVLATLNILSPPARVIEPAIALSIIFVGADTLLQRDQKRDWRLLFAFCFGFIHGFGFANVLREMRLPAAALGWSLFSFNVGVEIGQACIVLAVAPLLALLYRRSVPVARRVVAVSSFGVVFAGSFWFVQRLFP